MPFSGTSRCDRSVAREVARCLVPRSDVPSSVVFQRVLAGSDSRGTLCTGWLVPGDVVAASGCVTGRSATGPQPHNDRPGHQIMPSPPSRVDHG